MTLLCIDNQQSPTHKGNFLQGGKQQPVTNLNQQQQHSTNHRWNSGSPPLTKSKERSNSEDRKSANNANSQTNSSRYKTELCRPYEESGTCKYGDKCQFAHGHKELRSLARHPKYKTELCRTFHSTGLCPYGPRCHFIHNSEQGRKGMLLRQEPGGRPKPLGSLGSSSGELSPTSSHGGSPTGSKSFDELFVSAGGFPMAPQDLASLVHQSLLDYPQEAYDVFGEGFGGGDSPVGNDGYGATPPALDLFLSRTPLTPNTPLDASAGFFRLPIFDLFHKQ